MLRIEYFDKNRFMKQVAANRGSVRLTGISGTSGSLLGQNSSRLSKA